MPASGRHPASEQDAYTHSGHHLNTASGCPTRPRRPLTTWLAAVLALLCVTTTQADTLAQGQLTVPVTGHDDLTIPLSAVTTTVTGDDTLRRLTTLDGTDTTVTLEGSCTFQSAAWTPPTTPPSGWSTPYGALALTLSCESGAEATVIVTADPAPPTGAVLFIAPGEAPTRATAQSANWQPHPLTQTPTALRFTLTDGGSGDPDALADGQITTQALPAWPQAAIPLTPPMAIAILAALLFAFGGMALWRRHPVIALALVLAGGTLAVPGSWWPAAVADEGSSPVTPSAAELVFEVEPGASESDPQTLVLTNTGDTAVPLGAPALDGPFVLRSSTCTDTLASGASCELVLAYREGGDTDGELTLHALLPSVIPTADSDAEVVLTGAGFTPATAVLLDGEAAPTRYLDAGRLAVTVSAAQRAQAWIYLVSAREGDLASAGALELTVEAPPGDEPLSAFALSPERAEADGQAHTVTVLGQGFTAEAQVQVAGQAVDTTVLGTHQLQAIVPADLTASPAELAVVVTTGHGSSAALTYTLVAPGGMDPPVPALPPEDIVAELPPGPGGNGIGFDRLIDLINADPPMQYDVVPGAIERELYVFIRGRVLDEHGQPLAGAKITANGQPDFGYAVSRADGHYEFATNGGGRVVLDIAKHGYLPAQKHVDTGWQDITRADDAWLKRLSDKVTVVSLDGSVSDVQPAAGEVEDDINGQRQGRLLFLPGTRARLVYPDGREQAVETLSVRITEYTSGENGPALMPGPLPPASLYTYAAELSADEALFSGASEVRFNRPVPYYLENFLGLEVGLPIPLATYDRSRALWVPEDDGVVIGILAVDAQGRAVVDIDGDGRPDPATTLNAWRFTVEELTALAERYPPGSRLWRTLMLGFTPKDLNLLQGECDPVDGCPASEGEGDGVLEDDCGPNVGGCIINVERGTVSEVFPVKGAATALKLSTAALSMPTLRTPPGGGTPVLIIHQPDARTLPLSYLDARATRPWNEEKQKYPETYVRTTLKLEIFGVEILRSTGYGPRGQNAASGRPFLMPDEEEGGDNNDPIRDRRKYLILGGLDEDERTLLAAARRALKSGAPPKVKIEACNHYVPVPVDGGLGGASGSRSFGRGGGRGGVGVSTPPAGWDNLGNTLALIQRCTESEFTLTMATRTGAPWDGGLSWTSIGNFFPEEAIFHAPGNETGAHRGNRTPELRPVHGALGGHGPVHDIAIEVAGYTLMGTANALLRQRHDLPPTPVPGTAGLTDFRAVHGGASGRMYFIARAGGEQLRVYARDLDGQVSAIAGNGQSACSSLAVDGAPALSVPLGEPSAVVEGPGGALYIADRACHRVYRLAPDGRLEPHVGTGQARDSGDEGTARAAAVHGPQDLAMDKFGILYIATAGARVRDVEPGGIIRTIAGTGQVGDAPDHALANQAALGARLRLAAQSNGRLSILDIDNRKVREVGLDEILRTVAGGGDESGLAAGYESTQVTLPADLAAIAYLPHKGNTPALFMARQDGSVWGVLSPFRVLPGQTEVKILSGGGIDHYSAITGKLLRTTDYHTGAELRRIRHDGHGRLVEIRDLAGPTVFERAGNGQLTGIVSPKGERTTIAMNSAGQVQAITNPAGERWRIAYEPGRPYLISAITDPEDRATTYVYDDLGQFKSETDPEGGGWTRSLIGLEQYRMQSAEGVGIDYTIRRGGPRQQQVITHYPDGSETEAVVDKTRSAYRSADGSTVTTDTRPRPWYGSQAPYPARTVARTPGGLETTVTTELAETRDGDRLVSASVQVTVNGAQTWTSSYDGTTRTAQTTSPAGRSSQSALDEQGRPLWQRLPEAGELSYAYRDDARLEAITHTAENGIDQRTWTFAYDLRGDLAQITDPRGQSVSLSNDLLGRPTQVTEPGLRTTGYTYDKAGSLIGLTPPGKPTHNFETDSKGRLTEYTPPEVPGTATNRTWAFDKDGRFTERRDSSGEGITQAYDPVTGQPTRSDQQPGHSTVPAFDAAGRLKTLTHAPGTPEESTLTLSYDGPLVTAIDTGGLTQGSVQASYDHQRRVTDYRIGNETIALTYDADNLITQHGPLTFTRSAQSGRIDATTAGTTQTGHGFNGFGELIDYTAQTQGNEDYRYTLTRDAAGRITGKTETVLGETHSTTYTYDSADRLIRVTKDGQIQSEWDWDLNGNRIGAGYDSDDQDRLTQSPATDRPIPSQAIRYRTDALGRRIQVEKGGQIEYSFLYGAGLLPQARLTPDGQIDQLYIYAERHSPSLIIEPQTGTTYRVIADHLGSPKLIVDTQTGSIVQEMDYAVWGAVTKDTNPGFQPFGFAGGLYEPETGLVRFGARDYDPYTGRWMAKDPIGFAGGDGNLFGYVTGDPVNSIDPLGLYQITGGLDTSGMSFKEALDARRAYNETEAGRREMVLEFWGEELKKRIPLLPDDQRLEAEEIYSCMTVSVDPDIDDFYKRNRENYAVANHGEKSIIFNHDFFASQDKGFIFFHEFRHLMDANNEFYLDSSRYIGDSLTGGASKHPGEMDADAWAGMVQRLR